MVVMILLFHRLPEYAAQAMDEVTDDGHIEEVFVLEILDLY